MASSSSPRVIWDEGIVEPYPRPRTMSRSSSVVSGSFTESVKLKAKTFVQNQCWVCMDERIQVCYVMAKEDPALGNWVEKGLIDFDLKEECNAIALCLKCHSKLDEAADPGLIFFPEDLEFFIRSAKKDAENPNRPKQVPTAEDYRLDQLSKGKIQHHTIGGLYRCFDLRPLPNPLLNADEELQQRVLAIEQKSIQQPKPWHGAPIAALRRAIAALGSNRIDQIVSAEQVQQLTNLRILYNNPQQHTQITIQDEDDKSREEDLHRYKS